MSAGRFEGRAVLVTGAGSGMGRAVAQRLVADGATVVVNDVTRERAEATVANLAGIPFGAEGEAGAVRGDDRRIDDRDGGGRPPTTR